MAKTQSNAEINRIHKLDGDSKLKAFVDISLGGLVITGLRIVEGQKGLFLGMPRHQGKDGKWYDVVHPVDQEAHQQLQEFILSAYNEQ
jgi:stage V sporulation protein G